LIGQVLSSYEASHFRSFIICTVFTGCAALNGGSTQGQSSADHVTDLSFIMDLEDWTYFDPKLQEGVPTNPNYGRWTSWDQLDAESKIKLVGAAETYVKAYRAEWGDGLGDKEKTLRETSLANAPQWSIGVFELIERVLKVQKQTALSWISSTAQVDCGAPAKGSAQAQGDVDGRVLGVLKRVYLTLLSSWQGDARRKFLFDHGWYGELILEMPLSDGQSVHDQRVLAAAVADEFAAITGELLHLGVDAKAIGEIKAYLERTRYGTLFGYGLNSDMLLTPYGISQAFLQAYGFFYYERFVTPGKWLTDQENFDKQQGMITLLAFTNALFYMNELTTVNPQHPTQVVYDVKDLTLSGLTSIFGAYDESRKQAPTGAVFSAHVQEEWAKELKQPGEDRLGNALLHQVNWWHERMRPKATAGWLKDSDAINESWAAFAADTGTTLSANEFIEELRARADALVDFVRAPLKSSCMSSVGETHHATFNAALDRARTLLDMSTAVKTYTESHVCFEVLRDESSLVMIKDNSQTNLNMFSQALTHVLDYFEHAYPIAQTRLKQADGTPLSFASLLRAGQWKSKDSGEPFGIDDNSGDIYYNLSQRPFTLYGIYRQIIHEMFHVLVRKYTLATSDVSVQGGIWEEKFSVEAETRLVERLLRWVIAHPNLTKPALITETDIIKYKSHETLGYWSSRYPIALANYDLMQTEDIPDYAAPIDAMADAWLMRDFERDKAHARAAFGNNYLMYWLSEGGEKLDRVAANHPGKQVDPFGMANCGVFDLAGNETGLEGCLPDL